MSFGLMLLADRCSLCSLYAISDPPHSIPSRPDCQFLTEGDGGLHDHLLTTEDFETSASHETIVAEHNEARSYIEGEGPALIYERTNFRQIEIGRTQRGNRQIEYKGGQISRWKDAQPSKCRRDDESCAKERGPAEHAGPDSPPHRQAWVTKRPPKAAEASRKDGKDMDDQVGKGQYRKRSQEVHRWVQEAVGPCQGPTPHTHPIDNHPATPLPSSPQKPISPIHKSNRPCESWSQQISVVPANTSGQSPFTTTALRYSSYDDPPPPHSVIRC